MSIPASYTVSVNPGVVSSGGNSLALNGIMLTTNPRVPINTVQPFANLTSVQSFFGPTSTEASLASNYFQAPDNSTIRPALLYFVQYPTTSVAAYLRGTSLAALTLTQLKALTGTLTIVADGVSKTSTSITLTSATSFSNAATIILAAFTTPGFTVAFDSVSSAFVVTSSTTGASSTMALATGTISAGLGLAAGTLSQGAVATDPTTTMVGITKATQDWASFMTLFEPVTADKLAFAAWVNSTDDTFTYVGWDTDANAIVSGNTTTFGAQLLANNSSGTIPISGDAAAAAAVGTTLSAVLPQVAAFVVGMIASLDFGRRNGRKNFKFRTQSGLLPSVADATVASILTANGYNYYGVNANAANNWIFFAEGSISGPFKWANTYVNQIWMNSQFQTALMTLLTNVNSVPYDPDGYTLIEAACMDPINQALNFGAIRPGVTLSALQAAEVNDAAGLAIDGTLNTRGWYLQILDPGAQVRGNRGTPQMTFWYMDGGDVNRMNLASIVVQ